MAVSSNSLRDRTAIVGVGATPYYFRGTSAPKTKDELIGEAILAAVRDAGLTIADVDGLAYHGTWAGSPDSAYFAQTLGIPELTYSAGVTGGGSGSAGSVGLAATAIVSGVAQTVVCVVGLQQSSSERFGQNLPPTDAPGELARVAGVLAPGHSYALIPARHMHLYGTKREHFAEVVISLRNNALSRPTALRRKPLSLDDYFNAPMLCDPLCRLDFCMESEGAVAVVVTSAERAKDLRQKPVYVTAAVQGGAGRWGKSVEWFAMDDDIFASSGHRSLAHRLYNMAGFGAGDIDVALLYDHFSPFVIFQLEDYGFCPIGEGGPFVADGNIRFPTGAIPVNTHGGQLSEAYILGMTNVREAVEQLRGTATNQVKDARTALVTGGPSSLPMSALILRNET